MVTNESIYNLIFNSVDNSEFDSKLAELISAPSETINALKFFSESKINEPLTDEQKSKISAIYNEVLPKLINNLNDKNSIKNFLAIRSFSFKNKFLSDLLQKDIFPIFLEKRKEIKNRINNSEIEPEEFSYINDFLNADQTTFVLSSVQTNEFIGFSKLILEKDPENISKYDSIQNLANKVLNYINKNKAIDPNYILYFIELSNNGIELPQKIENAFNSYLRDEEKSNMTDIKIFTFSSLSKVFQLSKNDTLPEKYKDSINTVLSKYILRLRQNPNIALDLFTDVVKNLNDNFFDYEQDFIHFLYTDIFREGYKDFSSIEQLDFFIKVKDASLLNSKNKSFYFKEYKENAINLFSEKRKEIYNKIQSNDVEKNELEYLDKFLTTNIITFTLNTDESKKVQQFFSIIQNVDAENIANYQCFNKMAESILKKSIEDNEINPAYLNYLIETSKDGNVYTADVKDKINKFILNTENLCLIDFSKMEFDQISNLYAYANDESLPKEYREILSNLLEGTFKQMRENTDKCLPFLKEAFNSISVNDLSDKDNAFIDAIIDRVIKEVSCDYKSIKSVQNLRSFKSLIASLDTNKSKFINSKINDAIIKEQVSFFKENVNPKIESGEIDKDEFKLFDELLCLESGTFILSEERINKYINFLKIAKEKDPENIANYEIFKNVSLKLIMQLRGKKGITPECENFFNEALSGDKVLSFSIITKYCKEYLKRETDENKKDDFIKLRDSYFSRLLDKIKSSDTPNPNDIKDINKFIESYLDYTYIDNYYANNELEFNFISKYAEIILSKDNNALVDNDTISHLYQFSQLDCFPKEMREALNNIFSSYKQSHLVPNMEAYEEKVSSFEPMSQEEFEQFSSDLAIVKNALGMIPEKYCDYLISQKLNENSELNKNLDKYFSLFKRGFEDKAQQIAQREGFNKYKTRITEFKDGSLGEQNPTHLYLNYSENKLRILSKSDASLLATLFHEMQHAIQSRNMSSKNNEMSVETYEMVKEDCLRDGIKGFYSKNYTNMQIEIDARITGVKKQIEYLKYLGLSDVEISNYEAKDLLGKGIDKYFELEKTRTEDATKKLDPNKGTNRYVDQIFQDVMIDRYEKIFAEYPILGIEFEKNGVRKGNLQILIEQAEKDEDSRVPFDLCLHILKNYSEIDPEKMNDDAKLLSGFEPKTQEIREARDMVLRDTIIPFIEMQSKDGNYMLEMIQNVYDFISSNGDLDIFPEQREFIERAYDEHVKDSILETNAIPFDEISYLQEDDDIDIAAETSAPESKIQTPDNNIGEINSVASDKNQTVLASDNQSKDGANEEKEILEFRQLAMIDSTITATQRKDAMDFITSYMQKIDKQNDINQVNEKNDAEAER